MSVLADDRLLSSAEVARRVGVHQETVQRWARAGLLRAVRVGRRGRLRIPESELLRVFAAAALADEEEVAA